MQLKLGKRIEKMKKKTGVVILNFNDSESVLKLYKLIVDFQAIDKIVIVDNCSKDQSYNILKKKCIRKCSVIRTPYNGGYAYGNNYGIHYLLKYYPEIFYFVICNPDVIFKESLIEQIKIQFEKNKDIGLLSGVMHTVEDVDVKMPYGDFPSFYEDLFSCFYLYRYYLMYQRKKKIDYTKSLQLVEVVWGSLFAITKKAFLEINSFDENTFLYYEESILGRKLQEKGLKSAIITDENYIHNHGTTITKTTNIIYRNCIGLDSKYYYQTHYNHIGKCKRLLLKIAIFYSKLELHIGCFIKDKLLCFRKG